MRRISFGAVFYILIFGQLAFAQDSWFEPRPEGVYYNSDPGISVKCNGEGFKALPIKQGELFWGLTYKQAEADGVLNQVEFVVDQALVRLSKDFPLTAKAIDLKVRKFLTELEEKSVTHTLGGKISELPENCVPERVIRIVRSPIDPKLKTSILSMSAFSKLERVSQAAIILQGALLDSRYFDLSQTGSAASDLEYFTALLLSDQLLSMSKAEFIFRTYNSPSFTLLEWFENFDARLVRSKFDYQICGDAFQTSEKIFFRGRKQSFTRVCFSQDHSQIEFVKFVKPVEVEVSPQGQSLVVKDFERYIVNTYGEIGIVETMALGQDHQIFSDPRLILSLNQRSSVTFREDGSIILADIHSGDVFREGKWEKLRAGFYYIDRVGNPVLRGN